MRRGAHPVRMGEIAVAKDEDVLAAVGLGSCIALALLDVEARIAGLAHVLLPEPARGRDGAPGRFASTAVPALIEALLEAGASRTRLVAKLAGGASMFADISPHGVLAVGARNAEAVRLALERVGIPIVAEDLGGNRGRTVHLQATDGTLVVSNVLSDDVVL